MEDTSLTTIEAAILQRIQTDFPLSADPYAEIGAAVGCAREEAHAAVARLRERGVIRRIGGSFVAGGMGYVSALVAARVDPEQLEAAAALAGSFPEVTHNYERAHAYNLWFTVIAENQARLNEILARVRRHPGVRALHPLPALRTFKIRVDFAFDEGGGHAG